MLAVDTIIGNFLYSLWYLVLFISIFKRLLVKIDYAQIKEKRISYADSLHVTTLQRDPHLRGYPVQTCPLLAKGKGVTGARPLAMDVLVKTPNAHSHYEIMYKYTDFCTLPNFSKE